MHPLMVKVFGWYYMGIVHRVDPPVVITFDALHLKLSHVQVVGLQKLELKS